MKKYVKIILILIIIILSSYLIYLGFSLKKVADNINNIKTDTYKRTLENYATVIEYQYMASYLSGNPDKNIFNLLKNYNGDNIVCESSNISEDGKVTLINCKVSNSKILYSYIEGKVK